MTDFPPVEPKQCVADAAAWAARLGELNQPLFSAELRPAMTIPEHLDAVRKDDLGYESIGLWRSFEVTCREVAERRHRLLRDIDGASYPHEQGRLLLYDPRACTHEEFLVENGSMFDEADAPCWDLWVAVLRTHPGADDPALHSRCLVAWVPPRHFPDVEFARSVTVGQTLIWADDATVPRGTQNAMREAGLL